MTQSRKSSDNLGKENWRVTQARKMLSKMERLFNRLAKLGFSSTSFLASAHTQMMLPGRPR